MTEIVKMTRFLRVDPRWSLTQFSIHGQAEVGRLNGRYAGLIGVFAHRNPKR